MALLEVSNVSKQFGGLAAVSEVNFHVDQGEIISVIGPNGAGKTTIFNLLTVSMTLRRGRSSLTARRSRTRRCSIS